MASADLYVRPCYPELLMAREQALNRHIRRDALIPPASAHWNESSQSIFTGNSGGALEANQKLRFFPVYEVNLAIHSRIVTQICRYW